MIISQQLWCSMYKCLSSLHAILVVSWFGGGSGELMNPLAIAAVDKRSMRYYGRSDDNRMEFRSQGCVVPYLFWIIRMFVVFSRCWATVEFKYLRYLGIVDRLTCMSRRVVITFTLRGKYDNRPRQMPPPLIPKLPHTSGIHTTFMTTAHRSNQVAILPSSRQRIQDAVRYLDLQPKGREPHLPCVP